RDRARNAWTHAEENARKMRIVSPLDGLVVLKTTWKMGTFGEVQEGEDARPGTPIMDVVDPSAMRVRARINQADIDRVKVGQAVSITLDSYPDKKFLGRLQQLSPIASTSGMSSRVRTFLAIFSIDGADPHLLPDLAAAVDLQPAGDVAIRRETPRDLAEGLRVDRGAGLSRPREARPGDRGPREARAGDRDPRSKRTGG